MSSNILSKLKRAGYVTFDEAPILQLDDKPLRTPIPVINLAVSGHFDGGLPRGTTVLAGPSSSFKTALMIFYMRTFQKIHPDGIIYFLDTEGGTNPQFLKNFGVDITKILYERPRHMHELHNKLQVFVSKRIEEGQETMVCVDSIGSVATASEMERALGNKISADMGGRAKELRAVFRTTSTYIQEHGIYAIYLNHTYDTPEMYSERVMSGGSAPKYDAQNVIFLNKVNIPKELKRNDGDNRFNISVEKSRRIIDKSKFHIDVYQGSGIDTFSCLEDLMKEVKIEKDGKEVSLLSFYHGQWWDYIDVDPLTGELRESRIPKSELSSMEFWAKALKNPLFIDGVEKKYIIRIDEEMISDDNDIFAVMESLDNMSVEVGGEIIDEVKKTTKKPTKSKKVEEASTENESS